MCQRWKQQTEKGEGHLVERSSHRGQHVLRPCARESIGFRELQVAQSGRSRGCVCGEKHGERQLDKEKRLRENNMKDRTGAGP